MVQAAIGIALNGEASGHIPRAIAGYPVGAFPERGQLAVPGMGRRTLLAEGRFLRAIDRLIVIVVVIFTLIPVAR